MYQDFHTTYSLLRAHQADIAHDIAGYRLAARARAGRAEARWPGGPAPVGIRLVHALDSTAADLKCRLGFC